VVLGRGGRQVGLDAPRVPLLYAHRRELSRATPAVVRAGVKPGRSTTEALGARARRDVANPREYRARHLSIHAWSMRRLVCVSRA